MAGKSFSSLDQLESYLLKIIADCMNEVGEKVNELLREHVQTDVYDVGTQLGRNDYYDGSSEPTGQLRDSIVNSTPKIKGNEVTTKISHDSQLMEYDAGTFLHGSNYWSPNDVRNMLPYFINEGQTGGLFGAVWENLKRPYMTNTYDELVSQSLVKKWMSEALRHRGFTVI